MLGSLTHSASMRLAVERRAAVAEEAPGRGRVAERVKRLVGARVAAAAVVSATPNAWPRFTEEIIELAHRMAAGLLYVLIPGRAAPRAHVGLRGHLQPLARAVVGARQRGEREGHALQRESYREHANESIPSMPAPLCTISC